MNDNSLMIDQNAVRRTDTNSLLRLYDRAQAVLRLGPLQQEQKHAQKMVQRIASELQKRNVSVGISSSAADPARLPESLPVSVG
jgi:GGDEF-like domain